MTTQNLYNLEAVDLTGGLNVVTPRTSVAPGSIVDCYNYEIADHIGYRRMQGCERFDGRDSVSNVYSNSLFCTWTSTGGAPNPVVGDMAQFDPGDSAGTTKFFGTVAYSDATRLIISLEDPSFLYFDILSGEQGLPSGIKIVFTDPTTAGFAYTLANFRYGNYGNSPVGGSGTTLSDALGMYNTLYSAVRNKITAMYTTLSYNNSTRLNTTYANGLVGFKNNLYATRDLSNFPFNSGNTQVFPGDVLVGSISGTTVVVRDLVTGQGTWAGGDQQGLILFSNFTTRDKSFTNNENVDIHRGVSTIISNALSVTNTLNETGLSTPVTSAWWSELFIAKNIVDLDTSAQKWNNQGWYPVDLGYQLSFNLGTTNGPPPLPGRNASPSPTVIVQGGLKTPTVGISKPSNRPPQLAGSSPTPPISSKDWIFPSGSTSFPLCIQSLNDGKYTYPNVLGHVANDPLILTGFDFSDVPSDALIVGVQVKIGASGDTIAGAPVRFHATLTMNGSTTKITGPIASTNSSAVTQFTLGASGDLWGIPQITLADLNDPAFGVTIFPLADSNPTMTQARTDYVAISVFYQETSSVYYFWNGTDDVKAVITNINLSSGTWLGGDAAGTFQVAQVTPVGSATRSTIHGADQVWTAPGGTGLKLATITTDMTFAGLPSTAQIKSANAQSELKSINFYGNADWDAIYGCNGYGRAWVYDSFYFRYIYTGLSDALDKPRHLSFHSFCLGLAYNSGALQVSVPGSPESFDGVLGASEFDFGDPITGLARLNGTTLGIFCKRTIQALNGTSTINFSTSVLNPYEGAIEYTVVDSGAKPIYCSYKGISTFDQTSAYGQFEGIRLSDSITPFLLPRIQDRRNTLVYSPFKSGLVTNDTPNWDMCADGGILMAMPCRSKNQYRLVFKDGVILTMTFIGTDQTPMFTTQRICLGPTTGASNVLPVFLIPLAHAGWIDFNGVDRNFVSCDNAFAQNASTFVVDITAQRYVYELDRGWGFDGQPIQAYITTTPMFFDNPFVIDNIRKVRVHGQSFGAASINLQVSNDYSNDNFSYGLNSGTTWPAQDISLPRGAFTSTSITQLSGDWQFNTNIANVGARGNSFQLQFYTAPTVAEPPHILQSLQFMITENKANG